jgi:hypothetical protein
MMRGIVAEAIRTALRDLGKSQEWLGVEVARIEGHDKPIAQSSVSDWCNPTTRVPSPERLASIEKALKVRRGSIAKLCGYQLNGAKAPRGVVEAIMDDVLLSEGAREMLLAAYRAAVQGRRR